MDSELSSPGPRTLQGIMQTPYDICFALSFIKSFVTDTFMFVCVQLSGRHVV